MRVIFASPIFGEERKAKFNSVAEDSEIHVKREPFAGRDFSSITGIFPGQGVVFEGEFAEWLKGKSRFRDFFHQADVWAQSRSLAKPSLYLSAPQRLVPTERQKIRNLALFTLEVAMFEELTRLGVQFKRLAAYSFGEYAGWAACGAMSFLQLLEIVYWREELAAPAHELGSMVLVGAGEEKIARVLREAMPEGRYFVANRNLPEQTIIACEPSVADRVVKCLFEHRVACQKLQELGQPYHSPLMAPVASRLAEKIDELKIEISAPRIPFFSSVLNKWVTPANFDRKEALRALAGQLSDPVDFMTIANGLKEHGPQSFIELGPGVSCSALLAKLDPTGQTFTALPISNYIRIDTAKRKEYAEKVRQSKFISTVSSVVAQLTGYEIADISIEDRFQEDLGIDSLKKAEIVFEVLHKTEFQIDEGLNTSRFQALGDLVEFLEAGPLPGAVRVQKEIDHSTFDRYEAQWHDQVKDLRLGEERVLREFAVDVQKMIVDGESGTLRHGLIELLKSSDVSNRFIRLDCPTKDEVSEVSTLTRLAGFWRDFFMEAPEVDFRVALVGAADGVLYNGLNAFFQSMVKEHRSLVFLAVSCVEGRPSESWISSQIQRSRLVEREYRPSGTREKAWHPVLRQSVAAVPFEPRRMVWLGGTGGIAYELLSRYARRAEVELHILGRKPSEDLAVQDRIGMFDLEFAGVHYHQVDGADQEKLQSLLSQIEKKHGPIDLVVNAAGVDHSSLLKSKIDVDIADELTQKIRPAENLEIWCESRPKTHLIQFSSMVGLFGNAAQSVYSMANACIGALSSRHHRSLVIHWPAWQNVGMTSRPSVRMSLREAGIPLLKAEDAAILFWEDVADRKRGETSYLTPRLLGGLLLHAINYAKVYEIIGFVPGKTLRQGIEKVFHAHQDPYLTDHSISGKPVVPAATSLLMFLKMEYLINGEFNALADFEVFNPMAVDERGFSAQISIDEKLPGDPNWVLRSMPVFSRCRAVPRAKGAALSSRMAPEAKPGPTAVDSRYWYSDQMLFHGPRLQVIHKAWKVDSECLRAKVDTRKFATIYGKKFFDILMPMIDGYMQLATVNHYLERQIRGLPISAKSFAFDPDVPWTDDLWIQVDTHPEGWIADTPSASGFIYNDHNQVMIEIKGSTLREVGDLLSRNRMQMKD